MATLHSCDNVWGRISRAGYGCQSVSSEENLYFWRRNADSDGRRPPIPIEAGHLIRRKAVWLLSKLAICPRLACPFVKRGGWDASREIADSEGSRGTTSEVCVWSVRSVDRAVSGDRPYLGRRVSAPRGRGRRHLAGGVRRRRDGAAAIHVAGLEPYPWRHAPARCHAGAAVGRKPGRARRRLRLQPVLRPLRRAAPWRHGHDTADPCGGREAVRGLRRSLSQNMGSALRRISLPRRNSRFSRSGTLIRSTSLVVGPARKPGARSDRRTRCRSVSTAILAAVELGAAHFDG
jgi:hypothetical protein